MEILIFLFVIGIALMILFHVGAIILGPILVAGGTIGVFIVGIFAAIFGFLKLFASGLGKLSEVETGKSKEEQLKHLNKKKKKTVEDAEWEEIIGKDNVNNIKEETPMSHTPDNSFMFEDEPERNTPIINSEGKLPSGFFDGV